MHGGKRSTDDEDRTPSWDSYIQALRQEGRRFRPGKAYLRPCLSERTAGKPRAVQGSLFDGPAGKAATLLCEADERKERDRTQTQAPDSVRSQAARFMAWRADRVE